MPPKKFKLGNFIIQLTKETQSKGKSIFFNFQQVFIIDILIHIKIQI